MHEANLDRAAHAAVGLKGGGGSAGSLASSAGQTPTPMAETPSDAASDKDGESPVEAVRAPKAASLASAGRAASQQSRKVVPPLPPPPPLVLSGHTASLTPY
jgi:hypothetical protein